MSPIPDSLPGPDSAPDVPVRVRLIGRDFTLRVRPGDEARTRESVAYVDAKLTAFRKAHPMQNETTAALIVALALGDELLDARRAATDEADAQSHVTDALLGLDLHLAAALAPRRSPPSHRAGGDTHAVDTEGQDDDEGGDDEQDEEALLAEETPDGLGKAKTEAVAVPDGPGVGTDDLSAEPGEGGAEEPAHERPV